MRSVPSPRARVLLIALFISSHLLTVGCNDNSKTTGTIVQESAETKAFIKSKRESYKAGASQHKAKGATKAKTK